MQEVIATIKLAPGVVGLFDPITRVHLMISSPIASVYAGQNTQNLIRWVKQKKVFLVSGSLTPEAKPEQPVKAAVSSDEGTVLEQEQEKLAAEKPADELPKEEQADKEPELPKEPAEQPAEKEEEELKDVSDEPKEADEAPAEKVDQEEEAAKPKVQAKGRSSRKK